MKTSGDQKTYWLNQLRGMSPILPLPLDHERPPASSFLREIVTIAVESDFKTKVEMLALTEGVSSLAVFLAVLKVLLSRYTGLTDIAVVSAVKDAGGSGEFKLVPLRTQLSCAQSGLEIIRQVVGTAEEAVANAGCPLGTIVDGLDQQSESIHARLSNVGFILFETVYAGSQFCMSDCCPSEFARCDVVVQVRPQHDLLHLECEYDAELFDPPTIERFLRHFELLLGGLVAIPMENVFCLPLLTEAERQQLLVEWNDTKSDYPKDKCIHELFEEQVEKTPDAIAVVFEDQQLTYRQLNERANQLAHYLRRQGFGPEVLVGSCVERSLEMIIGILGILKGGGAYVPLDPTYPKERLAFMIGDTRTPVILTQRHLVNVLPEHTANIICLDSDSMRITRESRENPVNGTAADSLAYVIYTSGSTGRPKGVCVPHRGVVRLVKETNYATLIPEDVFLQLASISFDASTFEIWGSLLNGAKLVVMPPGTPSLEELKQAVQKHQITTLWLTAGLFHLMVDEKPEAFRHVRQLLAGGDVLSVTHVRRFLSKNPSCKLINGYGPTENTTFTCCHTVKESGQFEQSIPIGRPIANTQVYVLDSYLQPVPAGVPGELHIGGDGLAQGYLNQPELTAGKFIPNPFSKEPGARLYKSGDIARYLPDGNIEFLGRTDNQVKIRGFRIELGEIEATLGRYPAVREAAVIAGEDKQKNKRLVAYVALHQASTISTKELRNFLKEKLPDYMVPSAYVVLHSLPLTPNGKIDRKALPEPDTERPDLEDSYIAPSSPIEKVLAGTWCQVLGLSQVGIHDNFFELGGHSLLATQVMSRLRKVFEVEIPLRTLFESPTVEEFAFALLQREGECEEVKQRATLLLEVAELSEDEVNTMLEERVRKGHNKTDE